MNTTFAGLCPKTKKSVMPKTYQLSLLRLSPRYVPTRPELALNRHQEARMVMNIWAKIPGFGRAQFSALQLFFLCLVSPLLFAQTSTSDIQQAAAAGNAQAQFAVANDYFHARYVTLNYAEMLTWYRKSAARSNQLSYAPTVSRSIVY